MLLIGSPTFANLISLGENSIGNWKRICEFMYDSPTDLQIITFVPTKYLNLNQSLEVTVTSAGVWPYLKYVVTNYKNEIFIVFLAALLTWEPINCLITSIIVSKNDIMIECFVNAIIGYCGWILLNFLVRNIILLLYKLNVI